VCGLHARLQPETGVAQMAVAGQWRRPVLVGVARVTRRTGARRGASRYFLTVHLLVASSHVPLALSQSALVAGAGASSANTGAATASRRPVMTVKLSVFMNVSYLLEHPKMPKLTTRCMAVSFPLARMCRA